MKKGTKGVYTDTAGNVCQFVWYAPYGESLVDEHTTTYENPFKFSGKELDDITGLYDHGARSRNPISTLWYGVDPRYEEFPEMSPFAYCHGNPVRLIDPDGRGDEETGGIPAERNEDGTHIEARASTYVPFNIPPMTQHGNAKTEHSNRNEYDQNYGETVWGENISQDAVQSKAKNRGPNQDMVAMGSNEVGAFFLFGQWISKFFRSDSDEENGNSSATQSSTSQVPTQTVQTPKRDTIKVQLETRQHARDIFSDDAIIVDTIYEKQYRMNGKVVKRDTIKVKMKR